VVHVLADVVTLQRLPHHTNKLVGCSSIGLGREGWEQAQREARCGAGIQLFMMAMMRCLTHGVASAAEQVQQEH
jgi:hypothetical protein